MEKSEIIIAGDTIGHNWSVPVINFKGSDATAPKVYMQAALHAGELPGTAALHFLCQKLRQAEAQGLIAGDITIVPQANPIGTAQNIHLQMLGRFDSASGVNFNRDFPLVPLQDRSLLLDKNISHTATKNLKNNLLYLALGADIVIDLHCDSESLFYAYICEEFWPDAIDFAAALDIHSIFLADGQSTAFEEAVAYSFRHDDNSVPPRRFVSTLELRGESDVDETLAKNDATGLFRFLSGRGVITSDEPEQSDWNGKAVPLDNIEVVCTPVSGTILFNQSLGNIVKAGDLLATIISEPGDENGTHPVTAPQDGTIITRAFSRFAARGDQICKITCDAPSTVQRIPGALES